MSKAVSVIAGLAFVLAAAGLGYVIIQPILQPQERYWCTFDEQFNYTVDLSGDNVTISDLTITFNNNPRGLVIVEFHTYIEIEMGEHIEFNVRVDTLPVIYSQQYYHSVTEVFVTRTVAITTLSQGSHTATVELHGSGIGSIYNSSLLVHHYQY